VHGADPPSRDNLLRLDEERVHDAAHVGERGHRGVVDGVHRRVVEHQQAPRALCKKKKRGDVSPTDQQLSNTPRADLPSLGYAPLITTLVWSSRGWCFPASESTNAAACAPSVAAASTQTREGMEKRHVGGAVVGMCGPLYFPA
jgi:hypothetical protein